MTVDALRQLDLPQSGRLKEVQELLSTFHQRAKVLSNSLNQDSYTDYPSTQSLKAVMSLFEAAAQLQEHISIHMKIKRLELYQQEKEPDVPNC